MSNFVEARGARIYAINLRGGSADYACFGHVGDARRERGEEIVSVARIDDPTAECVYCGIRQGEDCENPLTGVLDGIRTSRAAASQEAPKA